MSQYYLISQLPSLDALGEAMPLPITEERFSELCHRFLGKRAIETLNSLTLSPPMQAEHSGSALVDAWNAAERQLRMALASARAAKMKKQFDAGTSPFPIQLLQVVRTATEMDDPLEAQMYLDAYRMGLLEALRPSDPFSDETVFYYGLKLKLLSHTRQFDEIKGRNAYRNIYLSVMGDEQEATT